MSRRACTHLLDFQVNLIFVGMIGSSFFALKEVGVGMVGCVYRGGQSVVGRTDCGQKRKVVALAHGEPAATGYGMEELEQLCHRRGRRCHLQKNLHCRRVVRARICGQMCLNKQAAFTPPLRAVLFLMLASAFVGASTDVRFTWSGYSWQLANCFFTSAYALYLRRSVADRTSHTSFRPQFVAVCSVMDRVAEHTTNKQKMDEFSMVYYNNLLVGWRDLCSSHVCARGRRRRGPPHPHPSSVARAHHRAHFCL